MGTNAETHSEALGRARRTLQKGKGGARGVVSTGVKVQELCSERALPGLGFAFSYELNRDL